MAPEVGLQHLDGPGAPSDRFVYNPDDPFDDEGERRPENLRRFELRHDILVYTSEALAGDVTVAGELSAEIYAATTGTDTDWVAVPTDVDPLGHSTRLSHYIVRALAPRV